MADMISYIRYGDDSVDCYSNTFRLIYANYNVQRVEQFVLEQCCLFRARILYGLKEVLRS